MILGDVITIGTPDRVFSLEDAEKLVPLVERIVKTSEERINRLLKDQRYMIQSNAREEIIKELENKVGHELISVGTKLTKLGLKVFGMNYVGFNNGFGYWSWYPGDKGIEHYHDHNESPVYRRKLTRITGNEQQTQATGPLSTPKV